MRSFPCAICQRTVEYDGPAVPETYPFCSERCRQVDLGRWFREQYSSEREATDLDDPGARSSREA